MCLGSAIVGCSSSPPLGQVEGTLLKGGQPLSDVVIVFIPRSDGEGGAVRSKAIPDAAGKFSLKTETGLPGAVVGEHVVILEDLSIYSAARTPDGTLIQKPVERFPAVYADPLRSPWVFKITPGPQTLDLVLPP